MRAPCTNRPAGRGRGYAGCMNEERTSPRFRRLPPPVAPDDLRPVHDAEPVHEELDDAYREQVWQVTSTS